MRAKGLFILLVLSLAVGCRKPPIQNLTLAWSGVTSSPRPSGAVAESLRRVPLALTLQDQRPEVGVVGLHVKINHTVRTTDNVGQHCADHIARMLESAGARLKEPPMLTLHAEILELQVLEENVFNGSARIRYSIKQGPNELWSEVFTGTSKRWGKTYNPANFNDALSNSIASTVEKLLQNDGFAQALGGAPGGAAPAAPAAPAAKG